MNFKNDNGKANVNNQSTTKQDAENILMIPKHRFDCVNLCLKETKQELVDKTIEIERYKTRIAALEKTVIESKVEKELLLHKAKNLIALKALIDFSKLTLTQEWLLIGLEEQISFIEKKYDYLFEKSKDIAYIILPIKAEVLSENR